MSELVRSLGPWGVWTVVFVGVAVTITASSRWLVPRWRVARTEIRRACTCGYVPAPPTDAADRVMRLVSRCLVWIQIGKVNVSGSEHFACSAPKLIAPTHGHYLDPFVIGLLLPERARYMAARGLLRFAGGLGGLILSRWGVFCTDLRTGRGAPALRAAVRILRSGQTLVMFPEGWANMDGAVGSFKRGTVSVARMTAARVGRPVSIVPVSLRYGTYPGPWITRLPTSLQCLIMIVGFVYYRRGVRVVVGKPLTSSDLPNDSRPATEALREAVLALQHAAGAIVRTG